MYRQIFPALAACVLLLSCTKEDSLTNHPQWSRFIKRNDKKPPEILFTSPTLDQDPSVDGNVHFAATITDNTALSVYEIWVTDDGGGDWLYFTSNGGPQDQFRYTIDRTEWLPPATYRIHGYATDLAGNTTDYESQFRVADTEGN